MKIRAIFFTILFLSTFALAQERFVMPVDEAKQDASFLAFRNKLVTAAERKDWRYVYSIVDPRIAIDFGGDSGIAAFKGRWRLQDKDSKFWKEILPVIKNGGAFTGDGLNRKNYFSAPYTFSSWPDDIDSYKHEVILGNNVSLRDKPSTDGNVKARLSYNVVQVDYEKSPESKAPDGETVHEWLFVRTLGGQEGFVNSEFVRSPINYRAVFAKKRGVWRLTFFVAGD